jgi:hypothetical protein
MGRLPIELLEKIVVQADFEIPESVCRSLPPERSVRVCAKPPDLRRAGAPKSRP